MSTDDVDAVFGLWKANFRESSRGRPFSYDRWGPGVPVPTSSSTRILRGPEEPAAAVRRHLTLIPESSQSHAAVAEAGGSVVGFVTWSVTGHPTLVGLVGTVEEVFVQPQVRGFGVGRQLVNSVMAAMDEDNVGVRRASVRLTNRAARRFWRHIGWEGDLMTYSYYAV